MKRALAPTDGGLILLRQLDERLGSGDVIAHHCVLTSGGYTLHSNLHRC
jgi:hypothetical protein